MRPAFPVAKDHFNSVAFDPVTTDAVRLEVQLRKGFSGGILQWRLKPDPACREEVSFSFPAQEPDRVLGFPCRHDRGIILIMWGRDFPAPSYPPNSPPQVAFRRPAADVCWIAADPLVLFT